MRILPPRPDLTSFVTVTLITACLDAEETIEDCLASVAAQTHPQIEHLVLDGGSTDRTVARIEASASERTTLVSRSDAGLYDALNRGIAIATGDVIGFLHSDDVFAGPEVLSEVAAALAANSDADACYADLVYVQQDDPQRIVRRWVAGPFEPGSFRRGWMPPHPAFFARASVYREMAGFDTSLRIGADWEWLLRFFELEKRRAVYCPGVWTRMRLGGVSNRSVRGLIQNNLETWRVCRERLGGWESWLFPLFKLRHRLRQFRKVRPSPDDQTS